MIAFLYDVAGSPPMLETLLAEIARIDPDLTFRSRIYSGSLLLRTMARYVVSASRDDKDQEKRMEHVDRGTVRTIAGDLAECFAAQRHTVYLRDLVIRLMTNKVECVALGTCPINIANELDLALHPQSWYLGYVEPDLGNPIQYELFIDLLTKHVQLAGPELLESWPEPITFPQDYRPYHHLAIQEWDFENVAVKLARFRGHFPLSGEGSTNGQNTPQSLSAGIPTEDRRARASWAAAGRLGARVQSCAANGAQLDQTA